MVSSDWIHCARGNSWKWRVHTYTCVLHTSIMSLYDHHKYNIIYDLIRRCHYDCSDAVLKMTVSRDKYTASPTVGAGDSSTNAMEKHWGQARQVAVQREPNTSLGISIVGGKVCTPLNFVLSVVSNWIFDLNCRIRRLKSKHVRIWMYV